MKKITITLTFILFSFLINAQVGIGNTDPKAQLDISAGPITSEKDGILIPRLTEFPTGVNADQDGMLVFLTGAGTPEKGFYYYDHNTTAWIAITGASGAEKIDDLSDGKYQESYSLYLGNLAGENDNGPLGLNIGIGTGVLRNTTGNYKLNIGIGDYALTTNTTGAENIAIGESSLITNSTGSNNIGIGSGTLQNNTTGERNVSIGKNLLSNTTGSDNIVIGHGNLNSNTTTHDNIVMGDYNLSSLTSDGRRNIAIGSPYVLNDLVDGEHNTAIGSTALRFLINGDNNTAIGDQAMTNLRNGDNNIAIGEETLNRQYSYTTAQNNNIGIGYRAGRFGRGNNNLYLGSNAGPGSYIDENNQIYISHFIRGDSNASTLDIYGSLGIGDATGTGYDFPLVDGVNGQVMTTDGSGNVTFQNPNAGTDNQIIDNLNLNGTTLELSLEDDGVADETVDLSSLKDADWYETGTSNSPSNINTDIFTQGSVAIGKNNVSATMLEIENTTEVSGIKINSNSNQTNSYGLMNILDGATLVAGVRNEISGSSIGKFGVSTLFTGPSVNGLRVGGSNRFESTGLGNSFGVYNTFASTNSTGAVITGIRNWFQSMSSYTGTLTGVQNDMNNNDDGVHIGTDNDITGTGSGDKYGNRTIIETSAGGVHYGIYSDVRKNTGFAGYFIGRTSLGSATTNRYLMPAVRGTNGQVMTTDGSGNVTFQNPVTDGTGTDNQTIDNLSLIGTTLNLSLEDDGQPLQTLNLGALQDGTGTDDQNIQGLFLNTTTNVLTVGIEGGSSSSVNLSSLNSDDDDWTVSGNNIYRTDVTASTLIGTSTDEGYNFTVKNNNNTVNIGNVTNGEDAMVIDNSSIIGNGLIVNLNSTNNANEKSAIETNSNLNNFKTQLSYHSGSSSNADAGIFISNNDLLTGNSTGLSYVVEQLTFRNNTSFFGSNMDMNINGNLGNLYAYKASLEGSGTKSKYGLRIDIPSTAGGAHYGIYSNVEDSNGYAGFFRGRVSLGPSSNPAFRYIMPLIDGVSGQAMITDGNGNVAFQTISDADNQTIDTFSFNTATNALTLEIEDDGVAAQTIDLTRLAPNADNGLNIDLIGNNNIVKLGGTLTEDTEVTFDNRDIRWNLNYNGDFIIQDDGVDHWQLNSNGLELVGGDTYWKEGSTAGTTTATMESIAQAAVLSLRSSGSTTTRFRANGDSFFNGGKVGIGDTTPAGYLDILATNSGTEPHINLVEDSGSGARINFTNTATTNGNVWTLFGDTDNAINNNGFNIFHTQLGNVIRLEGDGDIELSGNLSVNKNEPITEFTVEHANNDGSTNGLRIENSDTGGKYNTFFTSNGGNLLLYSRDQGNNAIGTFNRNSGAYTALSDRNLKTDFKSLYFDWDNFLKLETLTYTYKVDTAETHIGLVAQDVKKIYPELVTYVSESDIYHMNYSGFGVIAVKAVQELKKEVDQLTIENAKLKIQLFKYEALERRLSALENNKNTASNSEEK